MLFLPRVLAMAWLAFTCNALTAPLPIGDHSFESNGLTAGSRSDYLGPEWQETGGPNAAAGSEEWISGFAAEGTDHLASNSGHDVWQDLGLPYQANTRYTLTIAAGHRSGSTQPGNQTTYGLADTSGALHATALLDASAIPAGTFVDAPALVFDTTANPLAVGKNIRILLQARGAGRSHFDHIRLDATAIEAPGIATVVNDPATAITGTSAILPGRVTNIGDGAPSITIFYGDENGGQLPGSWGHSVSLPGTRAGGFAAAVTGLRPATLYYFSARATNGAGDSWTAASASFTTASVSLALVETEEPVGLTGSTATLRGEVEDDGNDPPVLTFFYGLEDGGPTTRWDHSITIGTSSGSLSQFVRGLLAETWYFFTVRAVNAAGTSWALSSASFQTTPAVPNEVVINEIHYDPDDETSAEEFVELHNPGTRPITVSGWRLSGGVDFVIPSSTTIAPGGYLVIAQDPPTLLARFGVPSLGPWSGSLANEGERLNLRDSLDNLKDRVDYGAGFPWPTAPRGDGGSAELINPSLDNELGGSWRSSGPPPAPPTPATYIPAASPAWRYRKGTSEASNPVDAWRQPAFVGASSWTTARTPIGYGDGDDNTVLSDMPNRYWSVYLRHEFTLNPLDIPAQLLLRIYVDDGCVVWLNGTELWRLHAPAGQLNFNSSATNHEAEWEALLITNARALLNGGTNVLANSSFNSSDFSIDAELRTPTPRTGSGLPTPGARNSSFSNAAPPQIRQVAHSPNDPGSGQDVVITAHITDPDGVGPVTLDYQTVDPGSYLRRTDPAYATTWTSIPMAEDGSGADLHAGDFLYSARLPASLQRHRRLVRYRINFEDTAGRRATAPYPDDGQPNFAYFVYDGLPAWSGSFAPGSPVAQFPPSLLDDLPVHHLLARETDVLNSQYIAAFDGVHMLGTLVYDGKVYDHIEFENRGEASTYVSGKNKWRFHFNRARGFEGRDDWGTRHASPWNKMDFEGCSSPWAAVNRGMAGLDEAISYRLYALAGVPSPRTNYLHFRVIDHALETSPTSQFEGDLWGLYLAVEPIEGSFLNDRAFPDGNIYKIEGGNGDKKEQGSTQPADSSDWTSFYSFSNSTQTAAAWEARMHLPTYYSFHAVNRLNGNVDLRTGYNHYFYHHPDDHWYVMPWDLDMMFISETHQGGTIRQQNCLNNPSLRLEFANRCREMLDFLCEDRSPAGGQIRQLIDEYADMVNPPNLALTWADLDAFLWNHHPRTNGNPSLHSGQSNHKGNFYYSPYQDSRLGGSYTRTLVSSDHEGFVKFLLDYTTDTFSGGTWAPGNGVTAGYGFEYLKSEAADPAIPNRPTIAYVGEPGFPIDDLHFESGPFSDPQGTGTFRALKWRVAEIAAPGIPAYAPGTPRTYEVQTLWESPRITAWDDLLTLPSSLLQPGRTYRVRVRHEDSSGRWSHWSAPLEFTAGIPDVSLWQDHLMITEIMYNPIAPTGAESLVSLDNDDFEFIELKNISATLTLDLSELSFLDGIEFTFADGAVTSLPPGGIVLVVRDLAAFQARYGPNHPVAGSYGPSTLSNSGERIVLSFAGAVEVHDFSYSDDPPWPAGADGSGPSLTLLDPASAPDHALPSNWTASGELMGSPGVHASSCETGAQWRNAHFSVAQLADPNLSGDLVDADRDGLLNLLEYAFDTNPDAPTHLAEALATSVVHDNGTDYLAISFRRRICRDHVVYTVQVSPDLVNWNSGPAHTITLAPTVDNGDGTEIVTVRSLNPLSPLTHEFLRLQVTYVGP